MKSKFVLAASLAAAVATSAAAADGSSVKVELNKLEDTQGGCRVYLVLDNRAEAPFEEFRLDLVLFGPDSVIARRLAIDVGPLRPKKTTVKLFDVSGLACARVGSILVNDVPACRSGQDARNDCIDLVEVATRGTVTMMK